MKPDKHSFVENQKKQRSLIFLRLFRLSNKLNTLSRSSNYIRTRTCLPITPSHPDTYTHMHTFIHARVQQVPLRRCLPDRERV